MPPPIDTPTLFLVSSLIAVVLAMFMALITRHGTTYPGFQHWGGSIFAYALAIILLQANALTGEMAFVLVANLLYVVSAALIVRGHAVFFGRSLSRWIDPGIFLFSCAVLAVMAFFPVTRPVRVLVATTPCVVLYFIAIGYLLRIPAERFQRNVILWICGAYALPALVSLFRALYFLLIPGSDSAPSSGFLNGLAFTCATMNYIASCLGYVALTYARTQSRHLESLAEVRKSDAKFRAVIEHSQEGLTFFDAAGRILYRSPSYAAINGYSEEERRGRPGTELVHPDDLTEVQRYWERLQARPGGSFRIQYRIHHKNGDWRWLESVSQNLLQNPDVQAIVSSSHDITESKLAELEKQKLTAHLNLLQAAVQASSISWVVTDPNGLIESVNPAFSVMSGYPENEAVGRSVSILNSDRHSRAFLEDIWTSLRRGEVWSGVLISKRKNGAEYHEHNTITPIRNPAGLITHYVAMKQDVTEQHQLEQQLNRSQRLESIGQLAAGVVHDLNNMLSPIMLGLSIVRESQQNEETLQAVKMMESASRRGSAVLRQVLTFARGVEGERSRIIPRSLVQEIKQLASETFPKDIIIENVIDPETCDIVGDLTQLHQVLLNLLVNARDAMPTGGVIKLVAANAVVEAQQAARQVPPVTPGSYVRISVHDTGAGISPEAFDHIFEPFFTTKARGKGTGLGLSTAFGIVRSHGGFFEVTTAVGKGSVFAIYFPALNSGLTQEVTRPAETAAPPKSGRGQRILLVEDEETVRAAMSVILSRAGYAVKTADDGEKGLALYNSEPESFSLVITDLLMPKLDGYGLAKGIRQHSRSIPLIIISGMMGDEPMTEHATERRSLNIASQLAKPFTEEQLLAIVQKALASQATP